MKLSIKTGIIYSLSCLAVLLLVLYPSLDAPYGHILRILVIFGVAWLIYFYFTSLGQFNNTKVDSSNGNDTSQYAIFPKPHVDELFQEIQSMVFSIVQSLNDSYQPEVFLFEDQFDTLVRQKDSKSIFSDTILTNNLLINTILTSTGPQTIYQKDCGAEWDEIFGDKTWRGSECFLANPIRFNNKSIGLFIIYIDHFNALDNKSLIITSQLSSLLTKNLENLDSLDHQALGNYKKESILTFISNLNFQDAETDIYRQFSSLVNKFVPSDQIIISSATSFFTQGVIMWSKGDDPNYIEGKKFNLNESLLGLPMMVNGGINDDILLKKFPTFIPASGDGDSMINHSVVGLLLKIGEEKLISVILERKSKRKFSLKERDSIKSFFQILSTIMNWQQEYQQIYLNATQDGLTGLLNHKTFMDRFDEEIQRAKRFNHDLVMLMFDLDKFKRINDTLGHPYGDYVIQTVSQILKDNVRLIDAVARYGGEEFVIILVNTNIDMAMPVATRIVQNIAEYPFSMDEKDVKMTISCGMSEYPTHSENIREVIDYADQAMYSGKKLGGNSVTVFESNN